MSENSADVFESKPLRERIGQFFRVTATLDSLGDLREDSLAFLRSVNLNSEAMDTWALVLTEAFVNAVKHGCGKLESAFIEITWSAEPERVLLEVLDPGPGPSDAVRKSMKLPEDPMEEGGRGLYLIYSLCDECHHWTGDYGHLFRMIKNHPGFIPEPMSTTILNSTMEELSSSYESLAAFYRLGEALVHANRVTTFIESAVSDLRKLVPADHYSMTWAQVLEGSLFSELDRMQFSIPENDRSAVMNTVFKTGENFIFESHSEVIEDMHFAGFATGCCLPIQAGGEVFGILNSGRKTEGDVYQAKDLSTLRTYTDLIGIAVAHANNTISRTREQQALREIEIAAKLQDTLVPTVAPAPTSDWALFVKRLSAHSVSGDYAEAMYRPDGRLLLVNADVMGKGVSAAFLAGMLRTAVHLTMASETDLNTLVHRINYILCLLVGELTLFATASFALINETLDSVEIANAGHCPTIIGNSERILETLEPSGPPLGLFPDQKYTVEKYSLTRGDWLIMITDGLFEWEINENEIWGWEQFKKFTKKHLDKEGEAFWNTLQNFRSQHAREMKLADDQTMIHWKRKR